MKKYTIKTKKELIYFDIKHKITPQSIYNIIG